MNYALQYHLLNPCFFSVLAEPEQRILCRRSADSTSTLNSQIQDLFCSYRDIVFVKPDETSGVHRSCRDYTALAAVPHSPVCTDSSVQSKMGSSTIYKKDGDEGKVDRRSCVGNWCISTLEKYRVNKLTIPQLRDSVVPPCRFSTLKTVPSPPRELKFRVPFVAIKRHCNVSSLFPPFPLAT